MNKENQIPNGQRQRLPVKRHLIYHNISLGDITEQRNTSAREQQIRQEIKIIKKREEDVKNEISKLNDPQLINKLEKAISIFQRSIGVQERLLRKEIRHRERTR